MNGRIFNVSFEAKNKKRRIVANEKTMDCSGSVRNGIGCSICGGTNVIKTSYDQTYCYAKLFVESDKELNAD